MKTKVYALRVPVVLILGCLCGLGASAQQGLPTELPFGEIRQALVIGNSAYKVKELPNPVSDAITMADALNSIGFEVTLEVDQNRAQLAHSVSTFAKRVKPGAVVAVFYAGHGVEVNGENYLIPIDLLANGENDVILGGFNLNTLLQTLAKTGSSMRLLMIDACRSNPFKYAIMNDFDGDVPARGGLAAPAKVAGTYVAFSTEPGNVAADNSVFAASLVKEFSAMRPGKRLSEVFMNVNANVKYASAGKQVPMSVSALDGEWYPFGRPRPSAYRSNSSSQLLTEATRLIALEDLGQALGKLDESLDQDWQNHLAYSYRGLLFALSGEVVKQRADFVDAIRANPDDPLGYLNRALLLRHTGKCSDALADFNRAVPALEKAKSRLMPFVYNSRAACLVELGNYAEAEKDLQLAAGLEGPRQ